MKWGFNFAHSSEVGYSTVGDQKLNTNHKTYNVYIYVPYIYIHTKKSEMSIAMTCHTTMYFSDYIYIYIYQLYLHIFI